MNIHNKNWAQYEYSYNLANSRENWAQKKKNSHPEPETRNALLSICVTSRNTLRIGVSNPYTVSIIYAGDELFDQIHDSELSKRLSVD